MNEKIPILVIEDEMPIREALSYNLRLDGFAVTTAEDGVVGLECVHKNPKKFKLILLDVMMPGMTGLEVLCELKSNKKTKDIPVYMLTAKGMVSDMDQAFDLGADDYIAKPFDPITLGQRLMKKLEKHSLVILT